MSSDREIEISRKKGNNLNLLGKLEKRLMILFSCWFLFFLSSRKRKAKQVSPRHLHTVKLRRRRTTPPTRHRQRQQSVTQLIKERRAMTSFCLSKASRNEEQVLFFCFSSFLHDAPSQSTKSKTRRDITATSATDNIDIVRETSRPSPSQAKPSSELNLSQLKD